MADPMRLQDLRHLLDPDTDEKPWMHQLTPVTSDPSMFEGDLPIQPLQVWLTEASPEEEEKPSGLIRVDLDDRKDTE